MGNKQQQKLRSGQFKFPISDTDLEQDTANDESDAGGLSLSGFFDFFV